MPLDLSSPIVREKLRKIAEDPVLWAKAFLVTYDPVKKKDTPWVARWYQAEMLRDKSLRKVYLCGRRTGKCIDGLSVIYDPQAKKQVTVESLYRLKKLFSVYCFDETTQKVKVQDGCGVAFNGNKPVYQLLALDVTTDREIEIWATANHPFYTIDLETGKTSYKNLEELKPGDNVLHFNSTDNTMNWTPIVSIRYKGIRSTYDITVPEYHNFFVGEKNLSILVHNSESMVVEALWRTNTNRNFVHMFVTPYENQIRLLFDRMKELINNSPLLKPHMTRCVNHPYRIEFDNGSKIIGFTTGASSGSGGASLRGQRCDWISLDEMDYMSDADFDTVTALCAERDDIGMTCSSTPTGARSRFYAICTDRKLGYTLHHHPSTHNPNWSKKMEEEFRAQLSESGYQHEIMAEFGDEEAGVFNKVYVDKAMTFDNYAYNPLTSIQRDRCEMKNQFPTMLIPKPGETYPNNPFRTMGVDWDRRQADSSILILDYDREFERFRVLKRVNFPKAEYTYDKAVQLIIQLNEIYNPSWIYADTGAGKIPNNEQ